MKQLSGTPSTGRYSGVERRAAASNAAPPPEQAFFHIDLRRSLEQHGRLARAIALGGVALAVLYVLAQVFWFKTWPAYEADSTIYVKTTPTKVLDNGQGARWPFDTNSYESYIQQQMMNVSREDVLLSAVHKLAGFQGPAESDKSAAQRLVQSLEVTRIGDSYQFTITARAGDPNMAAAIANAVTAAYIESASRDEHTGDAQRVGMLKEEKDRINAELASDRSEQDALNAQIGVASVGATVPDHYDEDITQTRTELVRARTEHDAAEAKFAALGAGSGATSQAIDAMADEMVATDAGLVSMKTSLNARRATLISQMANLTPANPQYKQDEQELARINEDLDAMMKDLRAKAAARIQLQLRADLQRTGGVESQLNGQLRQLVGSASSATPKMQRSSDLAADITRLQARYAAVDEQIHDIQLEDNAPAGAYQVTPATAPLIRSKTGVLRNAVLIAFAGLAFGLIAAVLAQKLDSHIYIAADVEQVLGFAPLAQLPDFGEVSEGVAEEYVLRLASAVEHGRKQGSLKNCIFTGTASGAGVSTLLTRVQVMLQAMGRPTVLVNATGAPAARAAAPKGGLASGSASGLAAGSAGGLATASASGLVPAQRLSQSTALLQQMLGPKGAADETLVLTDTAPVTVSAETEYLARFVDCAIVVVESGVTTRAQLREAAATLQRLDVGAVGFVLNRVHLVSADRGFRQAVEAVEEHVSAVNKKMGRRAEKPGSFASVAENPPAPAARPASHPFSGDRPASPRSMFEPEVAAAAAAVARFSPTTVTRSAAMAPTAAPASGSAPAPGSAPASGSASAPGSAPAGPVGTPAAAAAQSVAKPLPVEAEAGHAPTGIPDAQDIPAAVASKPVPAASRAAEFVAASLAETGQPTAPFVEAARHFAATSAVELGAAHPVAQESAAQPLPVRVATPEPVAPAETLSEEPPAAVAPHPADRGAAPSGPSSQGKPTQVRTTPETPAAPAESDMPWWLSEVVRAPEPVRPPVLWQPAKVWTGRGDRQQVEPASPPAGASAHPSPDAAPNTLHAHDLDAGEEASEDSASLSSRLSGLRNLLFVLGVKHEDEPHTQHDERLAAAPQPAPRYETRVERNVVQAWRQTPDQEVYPAREAAAARPADTARPAATNGASPRRVTAQPEFLPPKPVVIEINNTDAHLGESSTRQDRRAAYDRLDILPSKRGQYKKV